MLLQLPDAAVDGGTARLGERLLEMSLQLFCRARANDYFLMHGVTACFTLLPLLPLLQPGDATRLGRRMVAALLATFAAQQANSPTRLLLPQEEHTAAVGAAAGAGDSCGGCGKVVEGLAAASGGWGGVVGRLLAAPRLLNEHQYKMAWLGQHYSSSSSDREPTDGEDQLPLLSGIPDALLLAAAHKAAAGPFAGRTGEQPLPPAASF